MTTPNQMAEAQAKLIPCPFCGAGTTEIRPQKQTWNGGLKPPSEPISVSIWHWCEHVEGQPRRGIERVGRDLESAIEAWNRRAALDAQPASAELPTQDIPKERLSLNVMHKDCHKAADAFWKYWNENGETHKHGYYESTWGAINQALRTVGVIENEYMKAAAAAIDAARKGTT